MAAARASCRRSMAREASVTSISRSWPRIFSEQYEDRYWEAWRVLRDYAASEKAHPSAKAVELFQRALEIQAAEATEKRGAGGKKERIHRHRHRVDAGTSRKRLGCKCAGRRRECGRPAGVGNILESVFAQTLSPGARTRICASRIEPHFLQTSQPPDRRLHPVEAR